MSRTQALTTGFVEDANTRAQDMVVPPPLGKPWSATMAGQGFVVRSGRRGERCTNHVPRARALSLIGGGALRA